MFGWWRRWLDSGIVPDAPADELLEFPEEEEWYFDYADWRWKAMDRFCPEDNEDIPWAEEIIEDFEEPSHEEPKQEEPKPCCGSYGTCCSPATPAS